jgi:hypothetical protein
MTSSHVELPDELAEILATLPTREGGAVILLATGGSPPALSMLSTGDVYIGADAARVAVHSSSAAARHAQHGCSLLVPGLTTAYRVEMSSVQAREAGDLVVLEGPVTRVRPTAEPPWRMAMQFAPDGTGDPEPFVVFWRAVRSWLENGAHGAAPAPPAPLNIQ